MIQGLLIDLDGTLYVGEALVPGAAEAVERLRHAGLILRFLTNTTVLAVEELQAKLERLGLATAPEELMTAPAAAARLLRERRARSCLLLVRDSVKRDFPGIAEEGEHPEYIVIGDIGPVWNYALMMRLFGLVMGGAKLMALHKGRYWQTDEGLALDIGAFVSGLEYATGEVAEVAGKPSASFFAAALGSIGLAARRTLCVGDDLDSDIGGAHTVGLRGVLVRTGKYREAYARRSSTSPWRVIDSVVDLPRLLGLG